LFGFCSYIEVAGVEVVGSFSSGDNSRIVLLLVLDMVFFKDFMIWDGKFLFLIKSGTNVGDWMFD